MRDNTPESIEIAIRLKSLRENAGLSHEKLKGAIFEKYGIEISKDSLIKYECTSPRSNSACANLGMSTKNLLLLANFYNVSTDYILGRISDPSLQPCAADDLGLSSKAVRLIQNFVHHTSVGQDGIDALSLLIEEGFLMDLAWRIQLFCNHVSEDIELSNKYDADNKNEVDPKTKRLHDDLDIARDIEGLISAQHPEYAGRYKVFTGYRFIAAEKRELTDDFEKMLRTISGYDKFLAGLKDGGTWL